MKKGILFTLTLISTMSWAEVRETRSMKEALDDAREGDLVVLDIDNTILRPMQSLGSDQWYGLMVKTYQDQGLSKDEAINRAITQWNQVAQITRATAVESSTPGLIRKLPERGVKVLLLTARDLGVVGATLRQLKSIGVTSASTFFPQIADPSVHYQEGVIFVGPKNNKGKVLAKILEQARYRPSRIIFVDDKEHHVRNMDEVFSKSGLVNLNYRYGAADEFVSSLDARVVQKQAEYFQQHHGVILSDQEARELLSR